MKAKITLKDGTEIFRDIKPDGTVSIGPKDDIPVDRIKSWLNSLGIPCLAVEAVE